MGSSPSSQPGREAAQSKNSFDSSMVRFWKPCTSKAIKSSLASLGAFPDATACLADTFQRAAPAELSCQSKQIAWSAWCLTRCMEALGCSLQKALRSTSAPQISQWYEMLILFLLRLRLSPADYHVYPQDSNAISERAISERPTTANKTGRRTSIQSALESSPLPSLKQVKQTATLIEEPPEISQQSAQTSDLQVAHWPAAFA
jgi:hypothetical protein